MTLHRLTTWLALLALAGAADGAAGPAPAGPVGAAPAHGGVLMPGTRYATRYTVKSGAEAGPVVVVIGGLHGDEKAGYLAARQLLAWRITRGTLVVLPDAHKEAIRRNVRAYPSNMNRLFPGKASGSAMERLAYEMFGMIRAADADLLVTLHESRDFHVNDPARFGQTLTYDFPELTPLMRAALDRANPDIGPRKHQFVLFRAPYPGCPTYEAWRRLRVPATTIETSRTLPLSLRVRYQLLMLEALFDAAGLGYEPAGVPRLSTAGKEFPPVHLPAGRLWGPDGEGAPDASSQYG